MKFVHFRVDHADYQLGVVTDHGLLNVAKVVAHYGLSAPSSIDSVIAGGEDALSQIQAVIDKASGDNVKSLFQSEDDIEYGPCVIAPEKIICAGTNYRKHAIESNMPIPTSPVLFSKFNNSLAGHKATVPIPADAKEVDYEVELVIVMGKTAKDVSEEDALSYVFGYATGNDLSARDLQFRTVQWLLGKTNDGFAPIGPHLVTSDEIDNPNLLKLECEVNGELRQSSNTSDMIFNCEYLISYISKYMTLQPGDIIFTGTPEGVILGYPEEQRKWLKAGDQVVTRVENLGELHVVMG